MRGSPASRRSRRRGGSTAGTGTGAGDSRARRAARARRSPPRELVSRPRRRRPRSSRSRRGRGRAVRRTRRTRRRREPWWSSPRRPQAPSRAPEPRATRSRPSVRHGRAGSRRGLRDRGWPRRSVPRRRAARRSTVPRRAGRCGLQERQPSPRRRSGRRRRKRTASGARDAIPARCRPRRCTCTWATPTVGCGTCGSGWSAGRREDSPFDGTPVQASGRPPH